MIWITCTVLCGRHTIMLFQQMNLHAMRYAVPAVDFIRKQKIRVCFIIVIFKRKLQFYNYRRCYFTFKNENEGNDNCIFTKANIMNT